MRMWMVSPRIMCRQHLLGEHLECHMFAGSIKKKQNMTGYLENNLLEPQSLKKRHDRLVREMMKRGYHHKSPLRISQRDTAYLGRKKIDAESSLKLLLKRCRRCRKLSSV